MQMVDWRVFSKSTKHNKYYLPVEVDLRINLICWNPGYGRKTSELVKLFTTHFSLSCIVGNPIDVNTVLCVAWNMKQSDRSLTLGWWVLDFRLVTVRTYVLVWSRWIVIHFLQIGSINIYKYQIRPFYDLASIIFQFFIKCHNLKEKSKVYNLMLYIIDSIIMMFRV